ncbi:MAG: hypothetical protein FWD68_06205 [Alphaproteobacteria bacterium]|nr:hypothetical protein [Alphaproteobacteria bacterium]
MLGRFLLGAVTATAVMVPALAGTMSAEEARRFVAGKMFAFTCFDGTRGTGRILEDLGAAGTVQFSGSGPMRHIRLPGNTLLVRGQTVCASLKGMPFEPCFYLEKRDDRSFRGSIQGMAFAYCDFRHMGNNRMLMARAVSRRGPHHGPVVGSQELTMRMGRGHSAKPDAAKGESLDLRRSTD